MIYTFSVFFVPINPTHIIIINHQELHYSAQYPSSIRSSHSKSISRLLKTVLSSGKLSSSYRHDSSIVDTRTLRTYSIFERINALMVCIGRNGSVLILLLINAATTTCSLKIPPIFSFDRTVIVGRAKERVDALISKERPG